MEPGAMRGRSKDHSSADWRIVYGAIEFHLVSAAIFPNVEQLHKVPDGGYLWFLMPLLAIGGFAMAVVVIAASVVPPQEIKGIMMSHGIAEQPADRLAWRIWIMFLLACYLSAYLCKVASRWLA